MDSGQAFLLTQAIDTLSKCMKLLEDYIEQNNILAEKFPRKERDTTRNIRVSQSTYNLFLSYMKLARTATDEEGLIALLEEVVTDVERNT